MARIENVVVVAREICCNLANRSASLLENRIYPATGSNGFHIRLRTCSVSRECSCAGHACKWTGLNPGYDPFDIE